jgi:hypothetical protein
MDPYFVAVPNKLVDEFKKDGFEPVINGDKCDVLNERYMLGSTLFFYIQTPTVLKAVTEVLIGKDPADPTKDLMVYKINDRELKGPVQLDKKSWCGVFKTIAAPTETDDAFKMRLTLWTKGGSFFNPTKIAKLVYHCGPKKEKPSDKQSGGKQRPPPPDRSSGERLQSGGGERLQSGGDNDEESSVKKPAAIAGGTLLVLSMLGLALGLYWKRRQEKKRLEQLMVKIT